MTPTTKHPCSISPTRLPHLNSHIREAICTLIDAALTQRQFTRHGIGKSGVSTSLQDHGASPIYRSMLGDSQKPRWQRFMTIRSIFGASEESNAAPTSFRYSVSPARSRLGFTILGQSGRICRGLLRRLQLSETPGCRGLSNFCKLTIYQDYSGDFDPSSVACELKTRPPRASRQVALVTKDVLSFVLSKVASALF